MGNDGGRVNVKQSFKGGKGSSFAVLAAHLKLLGRHAVHFLQDQSGQYWSDAAWTWSDVVTVVILFCWAYLDLQVASPCKCCSLLIISDQHDPFEGCDSQSSTISRRLGLFQHVVPTGFNRLRAKSCQRSDDSDEATELADEEDLYLIYDRSSSPNEMETRLVMRFVLPLLWRNG